MVNPIKPKSDILGVISVCSFPSLSVVVLTSILNFFDKSSRTADFNCPSMV